MIGISTDDDRNAALQWLRHSNATISQYIDSGPRWTLEHMLGASSIPVTVLVDARGASSQGSKARDWNSTESIQLIERAFAVGRPGDVRIRITREVFLRKVAATFMRVDHPLGHEPRP